MGTSGDAGKRDKMSAQRGADNRRRRGGRGGGHHHPRPKRQPSEQPDIDENSPVIQLFRGFQSELDARHDKHERLVKLSRDITIDSKRAIFLLQRAAGSDLEKTLEEAEAKFVEIRKGKWRAVALELQNEDPYQFLRAYSPGLQEYIEAVTFWYYLKHSELINCHKIQQDLIFNKQQQTGAARTSATEPKCDADDQQKPPEDTKSDDQQSTTDSTKDQDLGKDQGKSGGTVATDTSTQSTNCGTGGTMLVHVPPIEYMLGVADLTGELMRMAISAVGKGELEKPYAICDFMRIIYDAFLSYGNVARELNRKMSTLRQSLSKVENACYMLQVRGSEIPKHMLADAVFSAEGIGGGSGNEYGGNMDSGE